MNKVFLALLLLAYTSVAGASGWQIEVVDSSVGNVPSVLKLNNQGFPCVSYAGRASGLRYAHWNGVSWSIQSLDSNNVIWATSLAIGSNDWPRIAYFDRTHGSLKYASWDGSQWRIEVVDTGGTGMIPALALDRQGFPHIAYSDTTRQISQKALKYVYWDGSSWVKRGVVDSFSVASPSALVLDSLDRPQVAYRDLQLRCLKYAHWDGSQWLKEIVDTTGGNAGIYPCLRFNSRGEPIISHIAGDMMTVLMLSRRSGSVWVSEMADWYQRQITTDWLYVFPNDSMSIAHTVDEFGVFVSSRGGAGWTRDTVTTGLYVGASLEVDPGGVAHVTYLISGGPLLYHAWKRPSGVVEERREDVFFSSGFRIFPNPFRKEAKISVSNGGENGRYSVRVYDVAGRLVKEVMVREPGKGSEATWDGTDRNGQPASTGVYFIVLEHGPYRNSKPVTLLR